jgi:nitrogen fixation/metabolism regulation signal transduction histidine kinase
MSERPTRAHVSRLFGQYIIKTTFQFKFSFVVVFLVALAVLSVWFIERYALARAIAVGIVANEDAVTHLTEMSDLILTFSLALLAMIFWLSLGFSHLIAGPIYRFERTLEEIREGNLSVQVRLRKHDEFKEVGEKFNQATASLRAKLSSEREQVVAATDKMITLADSLRKQGRAEEAAAMEQIVGDLRNTPPQIRC